MDHVNLSRAGLRAPRIRLDRMTCDTPERRLFGHLGDAVAGLATEFVSEQRAFPEEPYRPHPVLGHP